MYSYYNIATTIINKSLILKKISCSSNVIYGYHFTGKWTGAPVSSIVKTGYKTRSGMRIPWNVSQHERQIGKALSEKL